MYMYLCCSTGEQLSSQYYCYLQPVVNFTHHILYICVAGSMLSIATLKKFGEMKGQNYRWNHCSIIYFKFDAKLFVFVILLRHRLKWFVSHHAILLCRCILATSARWLVERCQVTSKTRSKLSVRMPAYSCECMPIYDLSYNCRYSLPWMNRTWCCILSPVWRRTCTCTCT